ncbi:Maf family protein [Neptunomonas antarctica]|uniref:dTTP/UTP pyrophosphatase n=1 Tax=Neptunomonas antarctica TaxID=619304 RepID=A0A1N7NX34_9GAMM|nr:nucleoside triphosphate pyrophosphatase [Neptunomonas antarctica]SIT02789.1 septum formation protein [Neptunomonas antarctica]
MPDLILASASPRRKELLAQIGVVFEQCNVDIDETVLPAERPEDYVRRLACEKSQQGSQQNASQWAVLGADTTVVVDGKILGKPVSKEDSLVMLKQLSGRTHQVMTGVALTYQGQTDSQVVVTHVTFKTLDPVLCQRYWQTGEPCDKAGGYGIQGFGAVFVEKIEGSYSNVVGLPLAETAELLCKTGIKFWQH